MEQEKQQQTEEGLEIDFRRVWRIALPAIKKLWPVILAVVILCSAAAVLLQRQGYTPSYKAYCTFSVHVAGRSDFGDTNSLHTMYYDQALAEQLDATFSYLVNSDLLLDDIKKQLGTDTIAGTIQASSIEGSNIFMLTATGASPQAAGQLLDALLAVYEDAARYVVGDMITEMIEGPVTSQTPYNTPGTAKGIAIGGAIGLVLCMGILLLYAILRRTVMEPADLEAHINMQCLGVVPILQEKRRPSAPEQSAFRESIRGIARKIETAMTGRQAKVLLVTSSAPGEGKSFLSQYLAESFAAWGKKVVLLDGDLRKPTLYQRFGFAPAEASLEEVLAGNADIGSLLFTGQQEKLTLVLNALPVSNPTVLINSAPMAELIASLSDKADLVIIDAPPCGQLSDAFLYQQYAQGVLYVVQQDRMSLRQIVNAAEGLGLSENKLLGYALNGTQQAGKGYGKYGYGVYSYGKYGIYGKHGHYHYGESNREEKVSER